MKKIILMLCVFGSYLNAQSGNTISSAMDVDGTNVSLNVIDYDGLSHSGLTPTCNASEDMFFRHQISEDDNKLTVAMSSAAVNLGAEIEYQILRAESGNLSNLQVVECDSYDVVLLVGGSFELVINDIDEDDEYFLRIYQPQGLLTGLNSLLNATTVTMVSQFDSSLSVNEVSNNSVKLLVKDNEIQLHNNINFNQYSIYGLSGKKIMENKSTDVLNTIDISQLNKGIYVVNLQDDSNFTTHKFIKY